jgi:diguanylate cyclase (GGDEF)-like protein
VAVFSWARRRRRREAPVPGAPAPSESAPFDSAREAEAAQDALAGVLRAWGERAFDLEAVDARSIGESFEAWARHVLVNAPPPGCLLEGPRPDRRDWHSLQSFVRGHRRSEVDYVLRSLADLRQVIWIFVKSLGRAAAEDRREDQRMGRQLHRLREAVESTDTTALKREALSSIGLIESLIARRQARQKSEIEQLAGRLDRLSVELIAVREQLGTDPLTQLYNRAACDEHVSRIVSFRAVVGSPAVAFMIDVDHFKWVNDRYGHAVGDDVLRGVARCLKDVFRRQEDFVARYGGDEFVVVLQEGSLETARGAAERLLFAIRDLEVPREDTEEPIRVSVSAGAARLRGDEDGRAWLQRADQALYAAKEAGRDRFVIDPEEGDPEGTSCPPGVAS